MKPSSFEYVRPETLGDAISALAAAQGDGKIIAGGQSLMPMLNFRLLAPSILVDISRLKELDYLEENNGGLRIGALTRHHSLESSPLVKRLFPVLADAMSNVAHLAIRNRGTIGGSITHADPAAELPLMMMLLDAKISLRSPRGMRHVDARDFFVGTLSTDVEEDEIVTEINLPALPESSSWAFEEVSRRAGDFALAAVGVVLNLSRGVVEHVRIAVGGMDEKPLRLHGAESLLEGRKLDDAALDDVIRSIKADVNPTTDLHASAEYRMHLVGTLARRALLVAAGRSKGE